MTSTAVLTRKKVSLDTKKFLEEVSFPFDELSVKPSDLLREGFAESHAEILKLVLEGDAPPPEELTARLILDEKTTRTLPPASVAVRIVFSIASDRDMVFKMGKAKSTMRVPSGKGIMIKEPYASLVSIDCPPGTSTMRVKRGAQKPITGLAVVEIVRKEMAAESPGIAGDHDDSSFDVPSVDGDADGDADAPVEAPMGEDGDSSSSGIILHTEGIL